MSRIAVVGTGIAGFRAKIGLIDDPIRSRQDADSELIRDRIWDWYINDFRIGKLKNTVSSGIRYFKGTTFRMQNGKGDTGNDYNTNISGPYPTDLSFQTSNAAFF
jgi:hypothetical protein